MRNFVVATPNWNPHYLHAEALERRALLRLHAYAGRWVRPGVDRSRVSIHPGIAALSAAFMRFLPQDGSLRETLRLGLSPSFDRWVRRKLEAGDHLVTSFGYANESIHWIRERGGQVILDAGNSHPELFWEIISEEHRRWGVDLPPVSRGHHRRALESAEQADWVIGLSTFVTNSFVERGLPIERTFVLPYPVALDSFQPRTRPRSPNDPLTLISTGGAHLRKGTPYLFEALKLLRKDIPNIRLQLNRTVSPTMKPLLDRYGDLPIEWFDKLDHKQLPVKLAAADIYVFPSLEDGLARAATEAMACGLPVILTENTGAADLIEDGVNGSVIPIRSPEAIRDAVLIWWQKLQEGYTCDPDIARRQLSVESFERGFDQFLSCFEANDNAE